MEKKLSNLVRKNQVSNEIKIGILGGAFNPPHKGHLLIAKKIFKKLNLDKVFFIPTGIPALKKKGLATAEARLAMTTLLIKKFPNFSVLDYEIRKKGKAYTSETLRYLKSKFKGSKIFWAIGEDSFRELVEGKWEKSSGLLDAAQFIVIRRPNHPYNLKTLPKKFKKNLEAALKKVVFLKLSLPISASEIREKIKKGEKVHPVRKDGAFTQPPQRVGLSNGVENYLTKDVLGYIKKKKLYK